MEQDGELCRVLVVGARLSEIGGRERGGRRLMFDEIDDERGEVAWAIDLGLHMGVRTSDVAGCVGRDRGVVVLVRGVVAAHVEPGVLIWAERRASVGAAAGNDGCRGGDRSNRSDTGEAEGAVAVQLPAAQTRRWWHWGATREGVGERRVAEWAEGDIDADVAAAFRAGVETRGH